MTQGGHSVSDNLVNLLNEFWCCMETIVVFASVPFTPNTVYHGLERETKKTSDSGCSTRREEHCDGDVPVWVWSRKQ